MWQNSRTQTVIKGFNVLFSSTDNRSFKQTNFPCSCLSSCPSYLKSSYYEINMWSRLRSWSSSVASRPAGRPAGRPGSGRSRRRGRWQRCFTPAPLAIFTNCVVNDWIGYMRYMLIYCRRINRVERYIGRKYILTAVIDSATKWSVL